MKKVLLLHSLLPRIGSLKSQVQRLPFTQYTSSIGLWPARTYKESMAPNELQKDIDLNHITPDAIHMVHRLIEECLLFDMDREECAACLEREVKLNPIITRIVWDELQKSNSQFFIAYSSKLCKQGLGEEAQKHSRNDQENMDERKQVEQN